MILITGNRQAGNRPLLNNYYYKKAQGRAAPTAVDENSVMFSLDLGGGCDDLIARGLWGKSMIENRAFWRCEMEDVMRFYQ